MFYLSQFFGWLLRSSVQACVVACLVLVVQALLRRRLTARWRCWLWLLVVVRLVLPWAPESPLSVFNLASVWPAGRTILVADDTVGGAALFPPEAPRSPAVERSAEPASVGVSQDVSKRSGERPSLLLFSVLPAIWLAGAAILAGFALAQSFGLSARVSRQRPLTDQKVLDLLEDCKEEMGVHAYLAVVQSERVKSPALLGFIRPRLLLPDGMVETLSLHELRYVFLHELAHLKRLDILANWLMSALQIMHWFNPLVWYAFYRTRADREMACDELALSRSRPGESREYGKTILTMLERFSQPRALPAMAGILEGKSQLKRRIAMIALFKENSYRWSALAVVLLVLLAFVSLTDARVEQPKEPSSLGGEMARAVPSSEIAPAGQDEVSAKVAQPAADETTLAESTAVVREPLPAETPTARPAATPAGVGVALVEFSRVGSRETLGEASAQMYELVAERLANAEGIRLVEREKLEKALEELKLNQTGLVNPATATKVGKIVGARIFVVGKLMKLGSEWVVTSRLIDTETSEVAAIRVTADESEGILALADATGTEIEKRLASFTTSTGRTARTSPLDAEIERLRQMLAGKELPTLVVRVPESHIGRWVPDPAGENELISVLSRVGYRVVDVSTFMKRQSSRWWLSIFHGPAQEREGTEILIREGSRSASAIMHDKRLEKLKNNADIFVMGEAFSEFVGENYGFQSCKARIEVKAIDTATEEIAVAASQHASGADLGEFIAGKKALTAAGCQLALQLARDLADYWEERAGSRGEERGESTELGRSES